jgi:hypothetical protein
VIVVDNEPEASQGLRIEWFSHLWDLGDIALQRRKWLDPDNTNPHWSYIEFACSYPDYDQLEFARKKGWLTAEELQILDKFRSILASHAAPNGDDYDNAAVLDDPGWHAVVAAARDATERLLRLVTHPAERKTLVEPAE